jgi:polyhydroxyalkanoate synthase
MNAPTPAPRPAISRARHRWSNFRDRLLDGRAMVQAGQTPFTVVHEDGLSRLRHYAPLPGVARRHRVPLVLVAPLAINMLIYDLFGHRSLVQFLLSEGFEVYLVDWGRPNRQHAQRNFHSYVITALPRMLAQVRAHSGQDELSLHGWSMGGIFVLLYMAYHRDPHVRNLMVLGSPIDAHASGKIGRLFAASNQLFDWIERRTGLHPRFLPAQLLHTSGAANALGYKLLDPVTTLRSHAKMLRQLDQRHIVEAHATIGAFLNRMVDYPGGVNRDMLVKVWLDNPLKHGEFKLGGRRIYLSDIQAALLVVAGQADNIVTIESLRPLMRLAGSRDKTLMVAPGGHVGMMSSEESAQQFWPKMADWLAARSD